MRVFSQVCLLLVAIASFTEPARAAPVEAPTDKEGSDHRVRLQTHFQKPLADSNFGLAGWVVLPDIISMSTSTLFLIGPRYNGAGWWIEGLAGGVMTAGDPVSHPWSLSGRFEFGPDALGAPMRVWGNLQLNDVMGDHIQPYALLMAGYGLMDAQIFLGIESENTLNWVNPGAPAKQTERINDLSIGPSMVLPFDGLIVNTSLQFHPEEHVRNQFWLRVMYEFGP